jgi:hypothetical protein
MKLKACLIQLAMIVMCISATAHEGELPAGDKTYHIIYVDNSRSSSGVSLSLDMIDMIQKKVDSIKADPNARVLFFLSNFRNPDVAKTVSSATKLVDRLTSGYSAMPDSRIDKSLLRQQIYNDDLSNIGRVRMHFFLTEAYVRNDLVGSYPGFLLNGLPREMVVATRVTEENTVCNIYVPKAAAGLSALLPKTFAGGLAPEKGFGTRIAYSVQAL